MLTPPLQKAVNEILRYKEGLRSTMIGPIWRRVLQSVMWTMSADADIESIVRTIRSYLGDLSVPAMEFLDKCEQFVIQLMFFLEKVLMS